MEVRLARLVAWLGFTIVLGLSGPIVQLMHALDAGTTWHARDLVSHGELYAAALGLSIVALSRVIAVDRRSGWLNRGRGLAGRWMLGVTAATTMVGAAFGTADALSVSSLADFGLNVSIGMYVAGALWSLIGEVILL